MRKFLKENINKKNFCTKLGDEVKRMCKEKTMYTWSAQKAVDPLAIETAKGCNLYDFNGKEYFDLNSGLMCNNLGHNHPTIVKEIKNQADKLCFVVNSCATKVRAEASDLILKKCPKNLTKLFYTLGGSDAVENAIKFCKFSTGRSRIAARTHSYHGATLGAMTLTSDYRRWPNEPMTMPGVTRIIAPYKYRCPIFEEGMTDEEYADKIIKITEMQLLNDNPESFAGFFAEPITGANGILIPPADYLQKLKKLCEKYGILFVADEVMTGFGRTGKNFAVEHWNIEPDILVSAKGLTSAHLPLGMVAISDKVAKAFDDKPFFSGLTYNSHPMSLAAAKGAMIAMDEEKVTENSHNLGKIQHKLMLELKEKHPSVGDVRCLGLFSCFELVMNRKTKEPMNKHKDNPMPKINAFLRENGVLPYIYNQLIFVNPPLIVKEHELRNVFLKLDKALEIADKCATN